MAIQQTKKQSDVEKRLRLLRQQVYGKVEDQRLEVVSEKSHFTIQHPTSHIPHPTSNSVPTQSGYSSLRSDITYLYQDLTKIFLLAGLALGGQIILFFLFKNNILNFNFF